MAKKSRKLGTESGHPTKPGTAKAGADKREPITRSHWVHFSVIPRKLGRWAITYRSETETTKKSKRLADGSEKTYDVARWVEKVIVVDEKPVLDAREAAKIADAFYKQLEAKRAKVRETHALKKTKGEERAAARWPFEQTITDWIATKQHPRTKQTAGVNIKLFKEFMTEVGPSPLHLDDITAGHIRDFHRHLDAMALSPRSKQHRWQAALGLLRWVVKDGRLVDSPAKALNLPPFVRNNKRDRTLPEHGDGSIVPKAGRDKLLAACKGTQERLLFMLYTLLGLRSSEAVHLRWKNYRRHRNPPVLTVTHADDWRVKTGERMIPVIYPEVADLLEQWYGETPYGRADEDWMFVSPKTKQPYRNVSRKWYERISRKAGIDWTPLDGRHTACSLLPLMSERLTGRRWSEIEHAQFFGHDFQTSTRFYIAEDLTDLASMEGLNQPTEASDAGADNAAATAAATASGQGFDADLHRATLKHLLQSTGLPIADLASKAGISDTSIHKFLSGETRGVPLWLPDVMRVLVGGGGHGE